MIEFETIPEFNKEYERFCKKYHNFSSDFERFKLALRTSPTKLGGVVHVSKLGNSVSIPIFKAKHFRCSCMKGKGSRSGVRVIYGYIESEGKIIFTHVYYKKNDDTDFNPDRLVKYFPK